MRLSLIDGDGLVWLAAYHYKERRNLHEMYTYLDSQIVEILLNTKADQYAGFIKGRDSSHRHKMFPDYKGTRPEAPLWLLTALPYIKDYLTTTWQYEFAEGQETDDCIASGVEKYRGTDTTTIVCSIDKDFKQLQGENYNPKTKETVVITAQQAERNLGIQILMGDATDNIKGLAGVGIVKATGMIDTAGALYNMPPMIAALEGYIAAYGGPQGLIEFAENAIKVTLKRDKTFDFKQIDVPTAVRVLQGKVDATDQLFQETQ